MVPSVSISGWIFIRDGGVYSDRRTKGGIAGERQEDNIEGEFGQGSADAEILALAEFMRQVVGGFVRAVRSEAGTPTSAQSETLGLLDRHGPMSIAELARHRRVKHQSMRLVLAQLEAEGLVGKAADPKDARRQLIDLSPKGKDVLARSRAARAEWIAQALKDELTQHERQSLRDALGLVDRLVRSHLEAASALPEHGEDGG